MWDDVERAALVALLRNRPKGMTYADVVAEVGPRESALDLWHVHSPPDLYGEAEELVTAREDVESPDIGAERGRGPLPTRFGVPDRVREHVDGRHVLVVDDT